MKEKELEFYEQIKDWDFDMFQIESEKLTDWDMYEILKEITDENSKVLDLGTGGGEKVLRDFPDCEILGTDFSKEMIKTANESGKKNITFRIMDNLEMDVLDEYFDVVVARNTVTDPKQIYKALKPGGYLLIRGVDKDDCHELKRGFGRGQGYHDENPISINAAQIIIMIFDASLRYILIALFKSLILTLPYLSHILSFTNLIVNIVDIIIITIAAAPMITP